MKNLPFSVFKRADRPCYLVAFKNDETGEYLPAISTKQKTESEAVKTAFTWLRDGIPNREGCINIKQYSLRDMAKSADITKADAVFICKELQRRGFLKSYVLAESKQAVDFGEYLREFWNYENSPYVKEKLRKKHGLHRRYVKGQSGDVEKYWIPFFPGKVVGDITWADVDAFISELGELTLSSKRKNKIITSGTVPLKWAFHRGMIDSDVSSGHTKFSGSTAERQILSPELAAAVFRVSWNDERARLANMLAMVTGIRAGEIQGLRVQDLGKDCLYVRHSWNFMDGLKTTKNNESRTVEVPFPAIIQELLALAGRNPHGASMDSFIFWAELSDSKPMEAEIFIRDLRAALVRTGMSKESAKAYTFHGWRHYFTAYMRERVNEKLLQSQTGHKTLVMLDHYSDHRKAGDRERIQQAQIESFGNLIPSGQMHN
ncbi:tyrosine-type recombinase/integrase [Treponema sp. R80B11-R83G3]